jgi:hypothetical protein
MLVVVAGLRDRGWNARRRTPTGMFEAAIGMRSWCCALTLGPRQDRTWNHSWNEMASYGRFR